MLNVSYCFFCCCELVGEKGLFITADIGIPFSNTVLMLHPLALNIPCSQSWLWTHNAPAATSPVGLQACNLSALFKVLSFYPANKSLLIFLLIKNTPYAGQSGAVIPTNWEAKAGRSWVQGQSEWQRFCLKNVLIYILVFILFYSLVQRFRPGPTNAK